MINGCGLTFYGVKNLVFDNEWEQYDTTKWFCVVWLPIFPIGSFRIQRKRRPDIISKMSRAMWSSESIYVLEKRGVDWPQALRIYAWVYGSYFLLIGSVFLFEWLASIVQRHSV